MNDDDDDDNSDLWVEGADLLVTILFKAPLGMGATIVFAGIITLLAYFYLS